VLLLIVHLTPYCMYLYATGLELLGMEFMECSACAIFIDREGMKWTSSRISVERNKQDESENGMAWHGVECDDEMLDSNSEDTRIHFLFR
jgi:hypothetical protein